MNHRELGEVGGVATTYDAGAAGWGALLFPAVAHGDWMTHTFKQTTTFKFVRECASMFMSAGGLKRCLRPGFIKEKKDKFDQICLPLLIWRSINVNDITYLIEEMFNYIKKYIYIKRRYAGEFLQNKLCLHCFLNNLHYP